MVLSWMSRIVFSRLILCSAGSLLLYLMYMNSSSSLNKLLFHYSVDKFNLHSIHVIPHRLIWQNLTTPKNQTAFLYGAYYDDRRLHNGKRFLQILAVGALASAPVYAVIWTENESRTNTSSVCTVGHSGAGFHSSTVSYDQFFYSCEVNGKAIPNYVSLTFNNASLQSNLLSVHVPEKKRKHKFSVCVETGYGHINPYQLVEWVEANKVMGVTLISVYPCNVSENNMRIFRQFESEGIMRVSYTPSPIGDDSWAKQMTSSPISFNDCMMRQMYSTDYIIPLDFDEIITPRRNARNYESLVKEIDRFYGIKESFPVYEFKMAYFLTTCGTENTGTMKMIHFIKKLPCNGNPKSFVNPRKCLSVFNHFCLVYFKNSTEPRNKRIDASLGQVNHYRIAKSKHQCNRFHKMGVVDVDFRKKFAKVILKQFNKKINKFRRLKLL